MGRIGFGTAHLYAGKGREDAVALLRAALEAGITWIDTAPLYGHGAAEAIVGEAIAGRRDQVFLSSKVGIAPSRITLGFRVHGKLAHLAGRVPGGARIVPPPAPRSPRFGQFGPEQIRASVEASLRALRTDRLDLLTLHECTSEVANDPAVLEVLQELVAAGKVRELGTATQFETSRAVAGQGAGLPYSTYQMPAQGWENPVGDFACPTGAQMVVHSLIGRGVGAQEARLSQPGPAREKAIALGIDPDAPDLGARLMAHAAGIEGMRAALFSSTNSARIARMAQATEIPSEAALAGAQLMGWAQASS